MGNRRKKAWVAFAILSALVLVLGSVTLVGAATECSDGVDNDGDNLIDFSDNPSHPGDPECESLEDDSEAAEQQPSAVSCFAIADEGDGSSTETDGDLIEDLLTKVDPDDDDPATNEEDVGSTGTMSVESLAFHPETGDLYGVNGGQLGMFNLDTGAFTATAQPVGTGSGEAGEVTFDNIDGLAFDPDDATLYGVQRESNDPDLLVVIDPATGALVPDSFGAGVDYAVIDPIADLTDVNDLAINEDGTVFAIATEDDAGDHLIKIDPANGNTTDVGATGLDDVEGLGFAPDGSLLGTAGSDGNVLVDINTTTGAASNSRTLDNGSDYEGIACQAEAAPPPSEDNVTGTKFHDVEPLGSREPSEGGVPDVEIHLFNEDGSVHEHTTTASDGTYGFTVDPGTYTICETLPDTVPIQSYPTEGADCSEHEVDEGEEIGPLGYEVTIEGDEVSSGNDFGNTSHDGNGVEICNDGIDNDGDGLVDADDPDCNVSGLKFDDADGSGTQDEGEEGLSGVEIHLFNEDGSVHEHTTTGVGGVYGFFQVAPGTYTVCETVPEDTTQTAPTEGADCSEHVIEGGTISPLGYEVTVEEGVQSKDNDFGNQGGTDGDQCNDGIDNDEDGLIDFIDDGDDDGEEGQEDDGDPECDDETDSEFGSCDDPDGDGTNHSSFFPDADERGPLSSITHSVDQAAGSLGGDGGPVSEVSCLVATLGL